MLSPHLLFAKLFSKIAVSYILLQSGSVCVTVQAFVLQGCHSGQQRFSRAFYVPSINENGYTDITNSTIPWVGGKDVILYRVETFIIRKESDISGTGSSDESCEVLLSNSFSQKEDSFLSNCCLRLFSFLSHKFLQIE